MSAEKPPRKKTTDPLAKQVVLGIGIAAAAGGADALHDHFEVQKEEALVQQSALERPGELLQFYTQHPYAMQRQDIPMVIEAMQRHKPHEADQGEELGVYIPLRLEVFQSLVERARFDEAAREILSALEEQAPLSAREILMLHRSSFLLDARFALENYTNATNWAEGPERYTDEVFELIRGNTALGTIEQRAHLSMLASHFIYYENSVYQPSRTGTDAFGEWYRSGYYSHNVVSITPELVNSVLEWLQERREELGGQEVFNPTIIAFYGNERNEDGSQRFGNEYFHNELQARSTTLHEFRGADSEEDRQQLERHLQHIETATTPITVVFDSHGGTTGIWLTGDFSSVKEASGNELVVRAEMIAQSFIQRYRNPELRAQANAHPDVVVFDNCFGGDIIRLVSRQLMEAGLPIPAFVSTSEAGTYGYGNLSAPTGSQMENILFDKDHPTLSDVADADLAPRDLTNPNRLMGDFVVIPARQAHEIPDTEDRNGQRMTVVDESVQISENESDTALG
ncbi:MAG TPA: hypothetical protein VEB18_03340 [Candidatus Paceibacterota bacterium]|nr:hypothetical protein [Candidatus Paceibacterota bacterium]